MISVKHGGCWQVEYSTNAVLKLSSDELWLEKQYARIPMESSAKLHANRCSGIG